MASKPKPKAVDEDADFAESLAQARHDAEQWLDNKAAELAAAYPSIPVGWHRQSLMARSNHIGCPCMAVIMQVEGNK